MSTSVRSLAAALALVSTLSGAQGIGGGTGGELHTAEAGAYTLRANAIASDLLPPGTTERHGIERAGDRGVLNVVILERRDGRQVTVRGDVSAHVENLLGQREPIAMRAIDENGRVSYLGVFGFAPLRNMQFSIDARPAGSSERLSIEFKDRFVARDR